MLQGQLADLGVERFEIGHVCRRRGSAKHIRRSRQQLLFPFSNLGGMNMKLLGYFGPRLVAFDRGHCHLSLEGGPVIAARSLHRRAPLVRHPLVASVKQGDHLAHCPNFRSPLYPPTTEITLTHVIMMKLCCDGYITKNLKKLAEIEKSQTQIEDKDGATDSKGSPTTEAYSSPLLASGKIASDKFDESREFHKS
jgi:hypothetical protein